MLIAICGKSGSGKSTLARILREKCSQVVCLDIDKIGHHVLENKEVISRLKSAFGSGIFDGDIIDRKKLGAIVFASSLEMKKLSDITWEYMQFEIDEFLKEHEKETVILDWQLLPISNYFEMCDIKILLDIPYEIRKQRAIKRDLISEEEFDLREKASMHYDESSFDYVIRENLEDVIKRLVQLI